MRRTRAVANALWFGILPWQLYEKDKHYDMGYWAHLKMNLQYAWTWLTHSETREDEIFEEVVNKNK